MKSILEKFRAIIRFLALILINFYARIAYLFTNKKLEVVFLKTPSSQHNNSLCLFVVYTNILQANHHRALKALYSAGYEVIIIANKPLTLTEEEQKSLFGFFYNHNIGRDIGGYCRSISYLYQTKLFDHLTKVLFLNDSVVFLSKTSEYFQKMNASTQDWVGVTESAYHKYHVSSWCFQLSKKCLKEPQIINFFEKFTPISSRHYLINRGEVEISQLLVSLRFFPRVFENIHDIINYKNINIYYLPTLVLQYLIKLKIIKEAYENREYLVHVVLAKWAKTHNSTHILNLNAALYNDFPFIKKDLRQREVHRLCELKQFVDELALKEDSIIVNDVLKDVVYKIPLSDMPFFKRKLYAVGLI